MLLREDSPGDKRLLAYIIGAAKTLPETGAIRTWLQDQVPEYMVPSTFMVLDGIPLRPSGETRVRKTLQMNLPLCGTRRWSNRATPWKL